MKDLILNNTWGNKSSIKEWHSDIAGYYLEKWGRTVYYDGHPQEVTVPLTYVMHHHDTYRGFKFNSGSTIFDPFGKTEQQSGLTERSIIVYNYGRGNG